KALSIPPEIIHTAFFIVYFPSFPAQQADAGNHKMISHKNCTSQFVESHCCISKLFLLSFYQDLGKLRA
ncbi:MAG: hypothetical protein OQK45_00455, partial [Sulfurovum sp.]|nr:hypothetical protein [Sulfurovum sp.]